MIDFTKLWRLGNIFSAVLLAISIFSLSKNEFNLGLDFSGGTIVEIYSADGFNKDEIINLSNEFDLDHIKNVVQLNGNNRLILKLQTDKQNENLNSNDIKRLIEHGFGTNKILSYEKIDFIGSQISKEFFKNSFYACILAIFGIMIYLLIRFDWRFAIGGIIGLVHDIIITIGFVSVFSIEVNMLAVTAILTIIGYSINDSVIIYDRIREVSKIRHTNNLKENVNLSLNDTLARTMFTSITTLLSVVVLIIFGGAALRSFSYVVFFGILIGTYSSVGVASQILMYFPSIKPLKIVNDVKTTNK